MIRNALMADVKEIQTLVNTFAREGQMLTLSLNEIYERIFEFMVWEHEGRIIGCCALHPSWEDLAEIRSLAVDPNVQQSGIGRQLVEQQMERAKALGICKVFALTYKPGFFEKLGFRVLEKDQLPKKIWTDCLKCAKFPDCDEIAVIREME